MKFLKLFTFLLLILSSFVFLNNKNITTPKAEAASVTGVSITGNVSIGYVLRATTTPAGASVRYNWTTNGSFASSQDYFVISAATPTGPIALTVTGVDGSKATDSVDFTSSSWVWYQSPNPGGTNISAESCETEYGVRACTVYINWSKWSMETGDVTIKLLYKDGSRTDFSNDPFGHKSYTFYFPKYYWIDNASLNPTYAELYIDGELKDSTSLNFSYKCTNDWIYKEGVVWDEVKKISMFDCVAPTPIVTEKPDLTLTFNNLRPGGGVSTLDGKAYFDVTIKNVGNLEAKEPFTMVFERATGPNGAGGPIMYYPDSNPAYEVYNPYVSIPALGSWSASGLQYSLYGDVGSTVSVRGCIDRSSPLANSGSVSESNEDNNCTPWYDLVIKKVPYVSILTVTPNTGNPGINPVIKWWVASERPITSCTASDDWTSYDFTDEFGKKIYQQGTTYLGVLNEIKNYKFTMRCSNSDGEGTSKTVTVSVTSPSAGLLPNLKVVSDVTPTLAPIGQTKFSATIKNIGDTSTGKSFTNLFQTATNIDDLKNPVGVVDYPTALMSTLGADSSGVASHFFNFTAGTKYIRVCADKSSATNAGVIDEGTGEDDNCGNWTTIIVGDSTVCNDASAQNYNLPIPCFYDPTFCKNFGDPNYGTGPCLKSCVCINPSLEAPYCDVPKVCANGADNPDLCTTKDGECLNGAVNPDLCTVDKDDKCLNGAINPKACDDFGEGTCTDGIKNANETGKDCGGRCLPKTCRKFFRFFEI